MAQNIRDNFRALAAVAEDSALSEPHPLMRRIMLRLSVAYRELEALDQGGEAPAANGAVIIPFARDARRVRWARLPTNAA